jgi:hypothetical protein
VAIHLRGKEIGFQYMNFFISTQKVCKRLLKKVHMGKKITKMQKKIIKPFNFMRNWPSRFTAERCRSALRHWCLNPKEMKGLFTQGSGID